MNVLIPEPIAASGLDYLSERGYTLRLLQPGADIGEAIRDCSAVLSRNVAITAAHMDAAPLLRVIAIHGVGADHIDLAAAKARGITLTWTPQANANAVAEHAIALLLAAARQIPQMDAANRAGRFLDRYEAAGIELSGKTLGIVGFGKIGRLTAQKAALGLGMRVLVWSRTRKDLPAWVTPVDSLDALLPQCDAVSLHVPLTAETAGLMDASRLALLRQDAILVNTARGGICDQDALFAALAARRIRAGIDVYAQEPCAPPDLPNAVLTPHLGAMTQEAMDAMSLGAAMSIDEVLTGKPITWQYPL